MKRIVLVMVTLLLSEACVTLDDSEQKAPPKLTAETPTPDVVDAAIEFGGATLENAKKILTKRNVWPEVSAKTHTILVRNTINPNQLMNAGSLYLSAPVPVSPEVFTALVRSDNAVARQLGWGFATAKPSKVIKDLAEKEITNALEADELDRVLIPEMARAVLANDMKSTYTVLRVGLMNRGHEDFARAMIFLEPRMAATDLLNYISLAPIEELRQLSLKSVNFYTCMLALRHLQNFPVDISHPQLGFLYLYGISRNTGLAEMAQEVIEVYLPDHKEQMALELSRQPAWVQVAFIENARRRLNSRNRLLLQELRLVASQSAVLDELSTIR
jgi:hypothetical protein